MANFCKFCGTKLEEGQACSCPQAQAELAAPAAAPAPEAAAPVATAAPAAPAGDSFVKKLLDTLKAYWKAPKATAAAVAEDAKGMTFAGVFAGVNVLAVFFYLWRIIGMLMDSIKESAGGKVDMDEIMELLEIELPIFPMLVAGLVIAVLGIVATALVVFIAAKLNKQAVDLKKQIVAASIHSLIPSALLIAGILLGFLLPSVQFIVLGLVLVLWFINVCNEARDVTNVQVLESGKTMTIYSLVIFAVLAIVVYAMVAIGGWGLGELSISGTTFNEIAENFNEIIDAVLGKMGTELIKELMKSIM